MAYGTDAGFTAYLASTGQTVPVGTIPALARDRGSIYIDGTYWERFIGTAASYDAAWPRTGITGVDDVPLRVEHASYEAGIIYANDPAALYVSASASGRVTREKVDVIEVSYQGAMDGSDALYDATPRFSVIEALLKPFLKRTSSYPAAMVV